MQEKNNIRNIEIEETADLWSSIKNFFSGKKESIINDASLVVDVDLLESKLAEIPEKLENFIKNQRVFREQEFKDLLREKFRIKNPDRKMIIYFLRKFNFVRKIVQNKKVFYIVGEKRNKKIENFEINQKVLAMGLAKMVQKQQSLKEEVKNLYKKTKTVREKNTIKALKMECVAKARVLKALQGKIMMIQNQIDLSNTAQDDVNMKNLIQETKIDTTVMEDAIETIREGVNIQQEIRDRQDELNNIIDTNNDVDVDLEKMFNALDEDGEATENLDDIYDKSVLKVKNTKDIVIEEDQKIASNTKLKMELYSEPSTVKKKEEIKIFNIEDVKDFHKEKYGEVIDNDDIMYNPNEKEVIYNENKVLVFNNKKNGLKEVSKEGASYADFKKQITNREKVYFC